MPIDQPKIQENYFVIKTAQCVLGHSCSAVLFLVKSLFDFFIRKL